LALERNLDTIGRFLRETGHRLRQFRRRQHGSGDRLDRAAIAAEALKRKCVIEQPHRLSGRDKADGARRHEQLGLEMALGGTIDIIEVRGSTVRPTAASTLVTCPAIGARTM
jgi:hypothetical protein